MQKDPGVRRDDDGGPECLPLPLFFLFQTEILDLQFQQG
jgi:hypothetical protein